MAVKEKDKVYVEYEGKLDSGEVFDSSALHGGKPLEFVTGIGKMIPGFDKAVIGMEKGDEKEISLKPEEAYGESNPAYVQKVPKDKFPEEIKEGMQIGIQTPNGQIPAVIKKIEENNVELDMNHPLAGKTLNFKIKLVNFEEGPFGEDKEGAPCSCGHDHSKDGECNC
jgi:FKBP-type peptidyl-prolyl cis-trans isomerase 2